MNELHALLALIPPLLATDVAQGPPAAAALPALGLGFVLGLRHALEVDHIAAVATIVSEHRSLSRSSLIGAAWGIGHTASLFAVGLLVIGLRLTIPDRLAQALEFGVALMLIALGINVVRKALPVAVHRHTHGHDHSHAAAQPHSHLHVHVLSTDHDSAFHVLRHARRPVLVGMVHGLAGSAALMLLVLTTIPSPLAGVAYIAVFGIGSIGGMLLMSSVIGLPFAWTSQRFAGLNQTIRVAAGLFSAAFGLFLAWQIGAAQGLLW